MNGIAEIVILDDIDPEDRVTTALENCIEGKCLDCKLKNNNHCIDKVMYDAIKLIRLLKSQNAYLKIKFLTRELNQLRRNKENKNET